MSREKSKCKEACGGNRWGLSEDFPEQSEGERWPRRRPGTVGRPGEAHGMGITHGKVIVRRLT